MPVPSFGMLPAQLPSRPGRNRVTSGLVAATSCVLSGDVRAHMASETSASIQGNIGPEVRHRCWRSCPAASELGFRSLVTYEMLMTRTSIDIDDEACAEVMHRYRLSTKRDAVNLALRMVATEPLGLDEARGLRGSGWDGDLNEMRSGRAR